MNDNFSRVAIVNRGEPAVRFIRGVRDFNRRHDTSIRTVALFTAADRRALFVREADEGVELASAGPEAARRTPYADYAVLERAIREAHAEAVWVGWGFVSEEPEFVELCERLGVVHIGPSAKAMRALGDKVRAKKLAEEIGVPTTPWGGLTVEGIVDLRDQAACLGYPVVIKPSSGSGGRGIRKIASPADLEEAYRRARDEAGKLFADATLYLERWVEGARHVEVQVVADRLGTIWSLGVRDCTVQRRHQKLVEEAPSPALPEAVATAIQEAAVRLCRAASYENAGTVEFLFAPQSGRFTFMEMNPRIQVEHAVTEQVTGVDLVELQLLIARGERLPDAPPRPRGHAIEVRLNAEDVEANFAASPGILTQLHVPTRPGLRLDTGVREGDAIAPEYDSMFAKLVAVGETREHARDLLASALGDSALVVSGGATNRAFLQHLVDHDDFRASATDVEWLDRLASAGRHISREHPDVALIAAAVAVYDAAFVDEREQFFASAARLRPVADPAIGRTVELRYRGERYVFRVYRHGAERYRLDVDGTRIDVRVDRVGPHECWIDLGERRHRVVTVASGLTHLVEVNAAAHRISRDDAGMVRALAPAVVVQISVAVGDTVVEGQQVAVLEAMKMETPILAPCAGTVREVLAMRNVHAAPGMPLLRIEPAHSTGAESAATRVRFEDQSAAFARPAPRGRPGPGEPSATTDAVTPVDLGQVHAVLDDLRGLMLGADVDAKDAARLVDEFRDLARRIEPDHSDLLRREDEILRIFADVSTLFRRQPEEDADDPAALSAGQYFLTYLRTLEARGAGLPTSFVEALRRALRHFGSDDLSVTPELKSRLMALYTSNQRTSHQVGAVVAVLERRLRHAAELAPRVDASFAALLDTLIEASDGQLSVVSDVARDLRYRLFEQPVLERGREEIYADMEGHLAHLIRDPAARDRAQRIQALVECPVPMGNLLSRWLDDPAPTFRELFLEVLTRRYYRIRHIDHVETGTRGGRSAAVAEYGLDGHRVRVLATHAAWSDLAGVLSQLQAAANDATGLSELVVDVYVSGAGPLPDADATAAAIGTMVAQADLPPVCMRVMVAIASPLGEWGASGTRFFTFRREAGGFVEERPSRGVHPMIAKRLELWRLTNFQIERLPSAEDIFLFRAVARSNPKDERFFALAEARDVTTVRTPSGTLERVPNLERPLLESLAAIREAQLRRRPDDRLHWNRVLVDVGPPLTLTHDELVSVMRRLGLETEGLGLEKVVLRAKMPAADGSSLRDAVISMSNPGGRGLVLNIAEPQDRPLEPLDEYTQKVVRMRQRGLTYPYEVVRMLTPGRDRTTSDLPPGDFVEHDLGADQRLVPVERPHGRNTANVVVGVIRNYTPKHPEGMARVVLLGDPGREMGSLAEPECRRILAALELAEQMGVPLEWFALSAGAKISMESGTENMDWIGRVLRKIVEFTQAGHEINILVTGINVGAQPYWNAEATMLMHTRGILVMMPESAMVLTGKTALDYSGSVSAEDNLGIGGYERIMGPNGQAQYWARDLDEACHILFRHYDHTYRVPGERFPRRAATSDPVDRDVREFPHARIEGIDFAQVGDVFSDETNPGRKKPFDIRSVMLSVCDRDHAPLERWAGMRDAEVAVVWDAHVGGYPACVIGLESRALARLGFVPTDGPDRWTSGTLFPMSSKKVARAINAASNNRPLVILANLSGFDGSPESMRRRQLEFGAEIGRAVVNFKGPIVFVVISRYHGGAFVVFSKALNDHMHVAALEGTYASVIGGAPAAAVVFAREVDTRTRKDPRVQEIERQLATASEGDARRLRARLAALVRSVRSERLGEVADEFDHVHSVHRALQVGSLDRIIPASTLRPFLVEAIEHGMRSVQT